MLPCFFTRAISRSKRPLYHPSACSFRTAHSQSAFASSRRTTNKVAVRSNGFITLDIHHPLIGSGTASPIIIYLPPGPVKTHVAASSRVPSALSAATSATVVQINYRLSREHKYPTCVHDVLAGYDWILQHLVPARAFHRLGRNSKHAVPIAACGELVGGGLATMLALTESRLNGPYVAAAAVNEPIVDWVFPEADEFEDGEDAIDFDGTFGVKPVSQNASKLGRKIIPSFRAFGNNGTLDAGALLNARSAYFRNPADYFDPFASPMLFFRTPGMTTPKAPAYSALDEFAELEKFEREDFQRQQLKLSSLRNVPEQMTSQDETDTSAESSTPVKKSYRRWPGTASGLKIPDLHVSFGDTSPLSDQAVELAMLVRKNIMSQNKRERKVASGEKQADDDREEDFALAEKKVLIQAKKGISFWSDEQSQELGRVAQWLRNALD